MKQVLFLCTGNSCRSHMAEGLTNHFLADEWQAYSAGTQPTGYVHPLAIESLTELGIDITGHASKTVDEFRHISFDLVVTVCDDAAENCPVWLGNGKVAHISFPDPAKANGTEDEKLQVFRQVRDDIQDQVIAYLRSEFP